MLESLKPPIEMLVELPFEQQLHLFARRFGEDGEIVLSSSRQCGEEKDD